MPTNSNSKEKLHMQSLVKEAMSLTQDLSEMDKKIEKDVLASVGAFAVWWEKMSRKILRRVLWPIRCRKRGLNTFSRICSRSCDFRSRSSRLAPAFLSAWPPQAGNRVTRWPTWTISPNSPKNTKLKSRASKQFRTNSSMRIRRRQQASCRQIDVLRKLAGAAIEIDPAWKGLGRQVLSSGKGVTPKP